MIDKKITFGIIVGTRGFFNPQLAVGVRRRLLEKLNDLGYGYVILPEDATPCGAVETREHAGRYARLFSENRNDIDGLIISLPNFGDELGVVQTIHMSGLNVPVLVQACNDEMDKLDVHGRRDSFCGKLSVCNNLYQYGIPFTDTSCHTCDVESDGFASDLDFFARVCRTVKGLQTARIGAIGARPAAFQTVRFSEKILQASGITVVPVDLSVILGAARALDADARAVKDKLARIREYGTIPARITKDQVMRQAKLCVAMEQWMGENECVASAVQCWTSIQENYGCAACLSMSLMGEDHLPSACEVDIAGTVAMYTLLLASGEKPGFLDWNNNYGNDANKCICQHCGNFPQGFMGGGPEISELDILGETLGRENCFGAIKGRVAPGPLTYFRISTDDLKGTIKAYLGQGEFTDDPLTMDGAVAVCRIPRLQKLMKFICQNGFEHHVAMTRGLCAGVIQESVAKYMNWNVYNNDKSDRSGVELRNAC